MYTSQILSASLTYIAPRRRHVIRVIRPNYGIDCDAETYNGRRHYARNKCYIPSLEGSCYYRKESE